MFTLALVFHTALNFAVNLVDGVLQLPLDIEAQVLQLRLSHFSLSRGLESVNSPLRFCPGDSISPEAKPIDQ